TRATPTAGSAGAPRPRESPVVLPTPSLESYSSGRDGGPGEGALRGVTSVSGRRIMDSRAPSASRSVRARFLVTLVALAIAGLPTEAAGAGLPPTTSGALPQAAALPPSFDVATVLSGLALPTAVRFTTDGRVFVAEKGGRIKVYDSLDDPTPTVFDGLLTNVQNYWDRGLLGMALDPALAAGSNTGYLYVLYSYDHMLGSNTPAPQWGDQCPSPTSNPPGPGSTKDGCVISGRVSRFSVNGTTITSSEQVLVEDWCQQFPSHSIGSVVFGPDGNL